MQLDIDVSPPANIMRLRQTLTKVTFDLNLATFDIDSYNPLR